jgi:chemotaxis protein MotB
MLARIARIALALIAVSTVASCSGQKIETLKDAICCDGGYEYRHRDRFAAEKDRQRLTDELTAARKENMALSARTRSVQDQLADRDRELASLRAKGEDSGRASSQFSSMQGDLDRSKARSADLERQLADKDKLAAELVAAQATVAALQAGTGDRDKLAGDLAQANKRVSELEVQLATLNAAGADKDRLTADLAAVQQRVVDLERQLADRDRELAGLRGDLSTEMAKLKEAQRGLIRALRPQIEKGNIMVDLNNERLLINLASGYLFGSGEDQLKSAGSDALKQVGAILKDFPEYKVSVDGHTDNRPIRSALRKKFPSNKELSEARASNAAMALGGGGLTAVTTHGYADTRPIMPNTTEPGRAKNRRVEVRVTR